MRARCRVVERDDKNNIVFLKDLANQYGSRSITNDAEAVVDYYRSIYGNPIRIVYLDTDEEWWELDWSIGDGGTEVSFKPWHGLAWDMLKR
jgi:hypothetical protein